MGKDPAFLFYPGDWLGGTMGMTFEEKGAYMELLMMQFNRGHMTSHMIGQTIGQLWVNIEDKFEVDSKGLYYNARLDIEKEKRKKFTESRKNNILGKNQYSKPLKNDGHMTPHMEDRNINEDKDVNKSESEVEIYPTFEDFWNCYNKKVGSKEKIKKKFDKLNQETREAIMNHIFYYVKATPDKKYRLNPETFFNQKAWENEIIKQDGKEKKPSNASERGEYFREHYPGYDQL